MESDSQLLAQYAQTGDERAFRELVERHIAMVYAFARRQAGDSLAEDITQAVFILLAQRAQKMPRETLIAGWLYQTTRLAAKNALRSERRRRRHEREAVMQALKNPRQDSTTDSAQNDRRLDTALTRLNRRELEAILGKFYQNMTHEELAHEIGITPAAAQKRVERALARLRHIMLAGGGEPLAQEQLIAAMRPAPLISAGLIGLVVANSIGATKGIAAITVATSIAKGVTHMKRIAKLKLAAVICLCIAAATITVVAQSESKSVPTAASMAPPPETAATPKPDPLFAEILKGYTVSMAGEQKWIIEGSIQGLTGDGTPRGGPPQKYVYVRDGNRRFTRISAPPGPDQLALDDPSRFAGDVIFGHQSPGKPIEDILVDRGRKQPSVVYRGIGEESFLEGSLIGLSATLSLLDALSLPLQHQQATPEKETVDGHECYLIRLTLPIGRFRVWLDPASGYMPRREIGEQSTEELIRNDPENAIPGPASGGVTTTSTKFEIDQVAVQKVDGRWLLLGARISSEGTTSEHSFMKGTNIVRREKVNLKPTFDKTSFDLAIPDGAPVRFLSPEGRVEEKTGVWKDGKILPKEAAATNH